MFCLDSIQTDLKKKYYSSCWTDNKRKLFKLKWFLSWYDKLNISFPLSRKKNILFQQIYINQPRFLFFFLLTMIFGLSKIKKNPNLLNNFVHSDTIFLKFITQKIYNNTNLSLHPKNNLFINFFYLNYHIYFSNFYKYFLHFTVEQNYIQTFCAIAD